MSQAELIFASNDRTKTIGLMGVVLVGLLSVVLLALWIRYETSISGSERRG
jgi:hypothetical protein